LDCEPRDGLLVFPAACGQQKAEVEEAMAQTTIMLEQRMMELVGAIDLVHSSYYSNREIIDAIAEFIATGQRPVKLQT
jgi:hypothetical protein